MSDFVTIRYALDGGVAVVTLAQPERLNAISPKMLRELGRALDRAEAEGARALLIAAEGRGFCSGADLTGPADDEGEPVAPEDLLEKRFNPFFERLLALPFPVVSAVNGGAAGGGCSLALSSDFVVAARSAYFLQAFVHIGLVPDVGATWLLPRLAGRARAIEMMMLGERIPADKAEDWGLIYKVVEDDALLDEAMGLARRLAAGPTKAYALIRKALRQTLEGSYSDALRIEAAHQKIAGSTEDCREGIAAFAEKRLAKFEGR